MNKKVQNFVIECTIDPDHKQWEEWDGKRYISYVAIKNELHRISQKEIEYNNSDTSPNPSIHKIHGFRIKQELIEITTKIATEILIL